MKKSPGSWGGTVRRYSSVGPSGAAKTAGSRKGKDSEYLVAYTTASTASRLPSVKDAEFLPKDRMPGFAVTAPRAGWTRSSSDVEGAGGERPPHRFGERTTLREPGHGGRCHCARDGFGQAPRRTRDGRAPG